MAVKFFNEVGEFVEVDVSYGYVFMTVKEKVRLGLDLSCLTVVKEFSFMDSNQTVRHRFRCMYYMFSSRS